MSPARGCCPPYGYPNRKEQERSPEFPRGPFFDGGEEVVSRSDG